MAPTPKSSANSSRTIMLGTIAVGIALIVVVWPLSRLSWITAPQSVFGSVPAATP